MTHKFKATIDTKWDLRSNFFRKDKKPFVIIISLLLIILLFAGCQSRKSIGKEINNTKVKIRFLDEQIYYLENRRGIALGLANNYSTYAYGTIHKYSPNGVDLAIAEHLDAKANILKSEREMLIIKLNTLMEKL